MPAKGPVSITRQTIYAVIPILDLYAAYHIKKLRWYLLIMILTGFGSGLLYSAVIPEYTFDESSFFDVESFEIDWIQIMFRTDHPLGPTMFFVNQVIVLSVAIYIIRRWSKKWNRKFID